MGMEPLSFNRVLSATRLALASNHVPIIVGTQGIGKTDLAKLLAKMDGARFFKIDGPSIVVRALQALAEEGLVDRALSAQAIEKYRLHDVTAGTTGNAGGES